MGRLVAVCGSARRDGDTGAALDRLLRLLPFPASRIDLTEKEIAPFSYTPAASADDFDEVVAALLQHEAMLFATPVYWYAMSGQLKTLFDRFSDLLSDRDSAGRGRALAGRRLWLLAVGTDPEMPTGFEVPFARTAEYLKMEWRSACYLPRGAPPAQARGALSAFAARIAAD